MKPLEQYRVTAILAREEAIRAYTSAHYRHHFAELEARAHGDWAEAEREHDAAVVALRASERETFNPLPVGLE